jgi:ketosteroid isomerase-like protein
MVFRMIYVLCLMKKLTATFIFILISSALFAQDKQAITKLMADQQTAWNMGDIDGFMQGYWKSDSLVFVGKAAPVYGWKTTLDHYKKSYPDKATMGQLTFGIINLQVLDDKNAFMLGSWHLDRTIPVGGYFTLWFRKINGEWKIVCDHTS